MVTGYRHCASERLTAEERSGATPFRILMEETMHALVRRRRHNARAAGEHLDARVDVIYAHVREALCHVAHWTRRKAHEWEDHLRILHPKWEPKEGEGPVNEWRKEWVASGFFDETIGGLVCCLPMRCCDVLGAEVNRTAVHVMALCSVDSNSPPTVRLRLSTGTVCFV